MSARVIAVAQQKGGAGKTTLVAQLAVSWRQAGLSVGLLDVDPQASLAMWHKVRRRELGESAGDLPLAEVAGWKLSTELDRLKRAADLVLIDSPPHAETDAKVAIRAADMILVPVQPSPMDLWAIRPTLELARREKVRPLIVLNRVPPRGRLPEVIRAAIEKDSLPVAQAALGNRVAFAASMMEGRGVVETAPRDAAAAEIRALADEVLAALQMEPAR